MAAQARWRRTFDQVERAVGRPLEQAIETRRFADVLVLLFRAQGYAQRVVERQTQAGLHLCNIPSHSDLKHINRQLALLAGEVRGLAEQLDRPSPTGPSSSPATTREPRAHQAPESHG